MRVLKSIFALTAGLVACVQHSSEHNDQQVATLPTYHRVVVDSNFDRAYQITSADIDGDNLPDLVAVSDQLSEIVWYENPHWEKHVLLNQTTGNIDLNAYDIDGDSDMDLAVACQFSLRETSHGGHVYWLENPGVEGKIWTKHLIDSIPTTHRIRWVDINADGTSELVNLPMLGIGATDTESDIPVQLVYYRIPEDPKADDWQKVLIDSSLHLSHGISIFNWDHDGAGEILTGSSDGLALFDYTNGGWNKQAITSGHEGKGRVARGAGEVAAGDLGNKRFLASIEPWHGDKVVFYIQNHSNRWERKVIDTTFVDGHALACFDLNNDGFDEILAGHRGKTYNLYIYQYQSAQNEWERTTLDQGGISAAGIHVFDANQDGIPEIAASGSATNNVVLYHSDSSDFR
jgi:hypothetical protein